jgi:hypothetical protein
MVMLAFKEGRISGIQKAEYGIWSGEAVAFCPRCKALQTVWLDGNTLMPTRKFYQLGNQIYHDCGSSQPCSLYRIS